MARKAQRNGVLRESMGRRGMLFGQEELRQRGQGLAGAFMKVSVIARSIMSK